MVLKTVPFPIIVAEYVFNNLAVSWCYILLRSTMATIPLASALTTIESAVSNSYDAEDHVHTILILLQAKRLNSIVRL